MTSLVKTTPASEFSYGSILWRIDEKTHIVNALRATIKEGIPVQYLDFEIETLSKDTPEIHPEKLRSLIRQIPISQDPKIGTKITSLYVKNDTKKPITIVPSMIKGIKELGYDVDKLKYEIPIAELIPGSFLQISNIIVKQQEGYRNGGCILTGENIYCADVVAIAIYTKVYGYLVRNYYLDSLRKDPKWAAWEKTNPSLDIRINGDPVAYWLEDPELYKDPRNAELLMKHVPRIDKLPRKYFASTADLRGYYLGYSLTNPWVDIKYPMKKSIEVLQQQLKSVRNNQAINKFKNFNINHVPVQTCNMIKREIYEIDPSVEITGLQHNPMIMSYMFNINSDNRKKLFIQAIDSLIKKLSDLAKLV